MVQVRHVVSGNQLVMTGDRGFGGEGSSPANSSKVGISCLCHLMTRSSSRSVPFADELTDEVNRQREDDGRVLLSAEREERVSRDSCSSTQATYLMVFSVWRYL